MISMCVKFHQSIQIFNVLLYIAKEIRVVKHTFRIHMLVTFIQSKTHNTAIRYVELLVPLTGIVKICEELCCFLYIRPCVLFFPSFLDPLLSLHYMYLYCAAFYYAINITFTDSLNISHAPYFSCSHTETFNVCASLLLVFFFTSTALILVILKIC